MAGFAEIVLRRRGQCRETVEQSSWFPLHQHQAATSCVDGVCFASIKCVDVRLVSTVLCPAFDRSVDTSRWP
jgi:hypothetical protein